MLQSMGSQRVGYDLATEQQEQQQLFSVINFCLWTISAFKYAVNSLILLKRRTCWDFPSGPVVKTSCSQCKRLGLIPGEGTRSRTLQLKIPHVSTKAKDLANCN